MTNSENKSSPTSSCCSGKGGKSFRILVGVSLIIFAAYAALGLRPVKNFGVSEATKIDEVDQRLAAVEKQLGAAVPAQATGAPIPLGPLTEEVDKLKAQVENKDSQTQMVAQKFVAEAFAFWDLRDAVRIGQPFAPELAILRNAAAGHAEILDLTAKLDAYALLPTATISQLRESFATESKAAVSSSAEPLTFLDRVKAMLAPLISFRSIHDVRFAAVEKALDSGNGAAALEAVKALPEDLQKGLSAWQARLEARVALDDAIRAIGAHFTTPPAAPAAAAAQAPAQESAPQ